MQLSKIKGALDRDEMGHQALEQSPHKYCTIINYGHRVRRTLLYYSGLNARRRQNRQVQGMQSFSVDQSRPQVYVLQNPLLTALHRSASSLFSSSSCLFRFRINLHNQSSCRLTDCCPTSPSKPHLQSLPAPLTSVPLRRSRPDTRQALPRRRRPQRTRRDI